MKLKNEFTRECACLSSYYEWLKHNRPHTVALPIKLLVSWTLSFMLSHSYLFFHHNYTLFEHIYENWIYFTLISWILMQICGFLLSYTYENLCLLAQVTALCSVKWNHDSRAHLEIQQNEGFFFFLFLGNGYFLFLKSENDD